MDKTSPPSNSLSQITYVEPVEFSRFRRKRTASTFLLVMLNVFSFVYAAKDTAYCYHSKIDRVENPSYSTYAHSSQDTSHLILHCPATDSLHRSLFGDSVSLYDLWSRPWEVAQLLGLHGLPPCPIPWKRSGNQQQQQHRLVRYKQTNALLNNEKRKPRVKEELEDV